MFDVGILWTTGLFWVRMKSSNGLSCHLFSLKIFPRSNDAKKLPLDGEFTMLGSTMGRWSRGLPGCRSLQVRTSLWSFLSTFRRRKHIRLFFVVVWLVTQRKTRLRLTEPRILCKGNRVSLHLEMGVAVMGFIEDFHYGLHNSWKYIFCPIWNLLYEKGNFKKEISKNILCNPPMGCFPFANSRFQMGVTVMGFAEDFGHWLLKLVLQLNIENF